MAGIDEVLERLLTDAQFARHLAQDPASALAGYELTTDDLTLLSTQVSFDPGALSLVEERISKSSFFGLVTSITGGLAAGGGVWQPEGGMSPEVVAPVDSEGVIGPSDSEGVIGPSDIQGALDPGDSHAIVDPGDLGLVDPGDKVGADGIVIVGGTQADDVGGGGGGAGSEVTFKEVDPAPQSTIDNFPAPVVLSGSDGAGGDVSIREAAVAPEPSSEGGLSGAGLDHRGLAQNTLQNYVDPVKLSEPEGGLSGPDGVAVQGQTAPASLVVQGGPSEADAVVD